MNPIHNEPCNCPKGQCAAFVDRDEQCVNRLTGDVHTERCDACNAHTWHQDGKCLSCAANQ